MRNFELLGQIRRASREVLIVNLLIAAVVMVFWIPFLVSFFGHFMGGPQPIDESGLATAQPETFVKVVGEKCESIATHTVDGKDTADLRVLLVGETILLVRTGLHAPEATTYEGYLVNTPGYAVGQVNKVIKEIKDANPGVDLPFKAAPLMLEATRGRTDGALHLLWGLIGLFCGWLMLKAWREIRQPELHPVFNSLKTRGDHRSLAAEIDREVNGAGYPVSQVIVTPHWLVQQGFMNLNLVPLDSIAWTYKKVTTTKAYGVVTTNVTYELILRTTGGQSVSVQCKEDEVMRIMELVYERVPWVMVGYDKELETLFNTRRAEFLQALAARKAAVEAGQMQVGEE